LKSVYAFPTIGSFSAARGNVKAMISLIRGSTAKTHVSTRVFSYSNCIKSIITIEVLPHF
ncbi:MAG: hypothetical protein ACJZ2G_04350, partial [Thalassobaculaceae bacterium]